MNIMEKKNVIIVGAGISGLILARQLADDCNVLIIEAAAKAGGRIASKKVKGIPRIIETGAEFIHGNLEHTFELLKEAGIAHTLVKGKLYSKEENGLKEQKEMIAGWDKLLKKMKSAEKDLTMNDFLQQYFGDEKHAALRKHAIAYTEGFDLADVTKVSVGSLYEEWSNEEEDNYRITEGYGAVISYLVQQCEKKGCDFVFNSAVKQVDWEKDAVTVFTLHGEKYTTEKLIITVSMGILQHATAPASINFTPALDNITKAAAQIGYGTAVKIILLFKERFWPEDTGFVFSDEIIPTWWTQLPDETLLLTGWAGGPPANLLSNEGDTVILEKALRSLSNIFNVPVADLQTKLQWSEIFNWQKNEYAMGAYSYATLQTDSALKQFTDPVDDTIFFCGESLYAGSSPGTAEAAIIVAKKVAAELLVAIAKG
jgi:monoamine oxidase